MFSLISFASAVNRLRVGKLPFKKEIHTAPMSFVTYNAFFPAILAIHNMDEYSRYDEFVRVHHRALPKKLVSRPVIRSAAILLSLFVALLDGLTYAYRSRGLIGLSKLAILALMMNAIAHCLLSLRRRSILPGTLSAATLVLPYSAIAIVVMRENFGDTAWSILRLSALGAFTAPVAAISSMWTGYAFTHRFTTWSVRRPASGS